MSDRVALFRRKADLDVASAAARSAEGHRGSARGAARPERENPSAAEPDWPPAVIAGAFQTGVLGVRSLVRRGVRATSFDCNPEHPGFRSVYGRAHLCPDPDPHDADWLRFMIDLARRVGGRPALIPSSDQFVTAVARHAEELSEHYLISPGIGLQALLAEKDTQYALVAKHGMPTPRTQFVGSVEDVRAFARDAAFPCLIKPTHFREWKHFPDGHPLLDRKVAVCETPQSLVDTYRGICAVTPRVILQEIIQGPDTAKRVYLSCYDGTGERIARAMFRELRCDPLQFGPATVSEPVVDAETDEVCDRFLRALGFSGICEIEMKWDSRDGRVKIIEANPRLSGGGDAAPYAGVDICWLHYLDLIGLRVAPVAPRGNHFRHIVLRADARAVFSYRNAGLISWGDAFEAYRPPVAFYDLDPRDWRYSTETLLNAGRSVFRGIAGWLGGRGNGDV